MLELDQCARARPVCKLVKCGRINDSRSSSHFVACTLLWTLLWTLPGNSPELVTCCSQESYDKKEKVASSTNT